MVVADHVQRVMKPNFSSSWEEVGDENQVEETFSLASMKDIKGKGINSPSNPYPPPLSLSSQGYWVCIVSHIETYSDPIVVHVTDPLSLFSSHRCSPPDHWLHGHATV